MFNSEEQRLAVKAYILADPVLSTKVSGPGTDYAFISAALNAAASPSFYVWRNSVSAEEWRAAIIGGGGATQLDALTGSKREALLWACSAALDPRIANVRAALDDFCGSQNTLKAAIVAAQKRTASVVEKILATGTGTSESPATAQWEGTVRIEDIGAILA